MSKNALLAGLRPAEKFLFSVVILFILGLAFQFLGAFLAAWIYDFRFSDVLALGAYDDPNYVAASDLWEPSSYLHFSYPSFLRGIFSPSTNSGIPLLWLPWCWLS